MVEKPKIYAGGGEPVLIGEYAHSLDAKGRMNFPAKLREEMGDKFVIAQGREGCLAAYSLEEWEAMKERILALPDKAGEKTSTGTGKGHAGSRAGQTGQGAYT